MESDCRTPAQLEGSVNEVIFALLPVKNLGDAKQRLAGELSPLERRDLCLTMLEDVLLALKGARLLQHILVFTPDEDVLVASSRLGVEAVRERRPMGQSEAVAAAIPVCCQRGATAVMTIPVDTPLLQGEDVDSLIGFHRAVALPLPSAIMVPSVDGTGTNSLLMTPPSCLPLHFGPDSLAKHLRAAKQHGIAYRKFVLPRLGLDIDSPADLAAFIQAAQQGAATDSRTYQRLVRSGIARRCRALVH